MIRTTMFALAVLTFGFAPAMAQAPQVPPWETNKCNGAEWVTFTPRSEGNQPACHTNRTWKVCKENGRQPIYASWCPAKVGTGKGPAGFQP